MRFLVVIILAFGGVGCGRLSDSKLHKNMDIVAARKVRLAGSIQFWALMADEYYTEHPTSPIFEAAFGQRGAIINSLLANERTRNLGKTLTQSIEWGVKIRLAPQVEGKLYADIAPDAPFITGELGSEVQTSAKDPFLVPSPGNPSPR